MFHRIGLYKHYITRIPKKSPKKTLHEIDIMLTKLDEQNSTGVFIYGKKQEEQKLARTCNKR